MTVRRSPAAVRNASISLPSPLALGQLVKPVAAQEDGRRSAHPSRSIVNMSKSAERRARFIGST